MDNVAENILPIIFIGFFAFVLWSIFSKSGKGRMLGGTIIATARDEITSSSGISNSTLRAHAVEANNGAKHVGLELSQNAKLAASMTPIKLSKQEAETLIRMLREVVEKT